MSETPTRPKAPPQSSSSHKKKETDRAKLIKKRDWRTDVNEAGEVVILRRGEDKAPNGDFYSGEFLEGAKHGKGRMKFAGGNVYDGDWAHDRFHGHGTLKFAEFVEGSKRIVGRSYKGYWKYGEMHGYGIFTKGDGETYEGEFRHNLYHGRGKQRLPNGNQFDGMFKEGQYHGRGFMRYADDSNYQGDFVAGMFHGQGTFRWPRGGGSYTGTFVKNRMDGFGKRVFSNKTTFEGEYKGGGMNGRGQLTRANGDSYEGEFMDNKFHGHGVMHYANGDSYRGQWQVGIFCGFGRFEYEAGGYYEGEYWALCRTGVKAALDENDLQPFLAHDSVLAKLANRQGGAKQLLTPGFLRQLHKYRVQARKTLAPSGVRLDLSARDRRKLYDKRRQVGAVLVGSEYDDSSRGGVMRPIVDGQRHGKGVRVWASGARYEGQWWQGEMHGFGIYVGAGVDGERFEGQFNFGVRQGRGIASYGHNEGGRFTDPLGNACDGGLGRSVYDGDWRGGLFHGAGTFTSADGRSYEGEFDRGKRSGVGRATLLGVEEIALIKKQRNKDSLFKPAKYEGLYANDKRHGKGMLTLLNGDRLLGTFRQGYLDGFVKYVTAKGEIKYAEYKNGQRQVWLHGKDLQNAMGREAAKSAAAGVFTGQATGADVRKAKNTARQTVKVDDTPAKRDFNILDVHVSGPPNADLQALEQRREARRKRQAERFK